MCKQGLIQELVENNLRRGTVTVQEEVRQLLCLVTRDNAESTKELCSLLTSRLTLTLKGRVATLDLSTAVRHEMNLLGALIQKEDSCWEQKLNCVMQLFLMACKDSKSPAVMESIILPCLKILQNLLKPEVPVSKKNKVRILTLKDMNNYRKIFFGRFKICNLALKLIYLEMFVLSNF